VVSNRRFGTTYRPHLQGPKCPKKTFKAFYESWNFITAFTRACHLSSSSDRSGQALPSYLLKIHMFSSMPRFPKWSFTFVFPYQNSVCISPRPAPPHSASFHHANNIYEECRLWSSSPCSLLHSRYLVALRPTFPLSTLFSKILRLCFSVRVKDSRQNWHISACFTRQYV
jgi:hypothetical protein